MATGAYLGLYWEVSHFLKMFNTKLFAMKMLFSTSDILAVCLHFLALEKEYNGESLTFVWLKLILLINGQVSCFCISINTQVTPPPKSTSLNSHRMARK